MIKLLYSCQGNKPVGSDLMSISVTYNLTSYCVPLAKLLSLLVPQFLHLLNKAKDTLQGGTDTL